MATPIIQTPPGEYDDFVLVQVSGPENAQIRYTTNGDKSLNVISREGSENQPELILKLGEPTTSTVIQNQNRQQLYSFLQNLDVSHAGDKEW